MYWNPSVFMFMCDPQMRHKCDNLTSDVFRYVSDLDLLYVGIHTYGTIGYVLPICHGQIYCNITDNSIKSMQCVKAKE